MLNQLFQRFFGRSRHHFIRSLAPLVEQINALEPSLKGLSDIELQNQTPKLKNRLSCGETLDNILPYAFATVREASRRVLGMRHFDVQIQGGIILHQGKVAEMKTGEGKTLVATLAAYLNALAGKGVHLITVNDYLATRDAEWMGKIYKFLGLTVGCIVHGLTDSQRKKAYQADITYGTNNEFGFDYLRDNMKSHVDELCQRPFCYAIVDEVDSILIDEARTPLIISGPAETSSALYNLVNPIIPLLQESDYEKDEKARSVTFTEGGIEHLEKVLKEKDLLQNNCLYDIQNMGLLHHLNQALRAHKLFSRDVDYIVKNSKIIIIDEFTGRMMEGRRYAEGLHQAIEAKEQVPVEKENQTLASITFQNYFRLYPKLAGMTGTAMTEAAELNDIYGLDVAAVPTHKPVQRKDLDDEVYRTLKEKVEAIISLIQECRERQQPVLVGTVSIEKSEVFAEALKKKKIPHRVLNARYHETEANIIAEAGVPGAVTIATNMAGRGTDIKPGGNLEKRLQDALVGASNPEDIERITNEVSQKVVNDAKIVQDSGGIFVIGTERHESRRIDNQLRGRTGRQGDPGASKFFLSLEDDLMRIFGSNRLDSWLQKLGLKEGEAITHPWINRALEKAQQKVEARNYEMRKHLLKYDNVMNEQRKAVYSQRLELIKKDDLKNEVLQMRNDILKSCIHKSIPPGSLPAKWNISLLHEETLRLFNLDLPLKEWCEKEIYQEQEMSARLEKAIEEHFEKKEELYGSTVMRMAEKAILLQLLDQFWKEHLCALDHLRQGVHLRAYGQKDPLNEYKQEAFTLFNDMLDRLREGVVSFLSHFQASTEDVGQDLMALFNKDHDRQSFIKNKKPHKVTGQNAALGAVSRNAPCPCGSGKRFKNCHGILPS